ncbi:MAG: endonuclease-3 [Candidatus Omnitrophota bacterium]|jgi:endonuclease-3
MNAQNFTKSIRILKKESIKWDVPVVTLIAATGKDPFRVLISCLLSLRTNDRTTAPATERLFAIADTPGGINKLTIKRLEKLIYPVCFYRNKAKILKDISRILITDYESKVPNTLEELLKFKGVGRKTANLVLSQGFNISAICVDVHVHRISNRLGFVETLTPDETEMALRATLLKKYWIVINEVFVAFGQQHCRPISPHCSTCKLSSICEKKGVGKSR